MWLEKLGITVRTILLEQIWTKLFSTEGLRITVDSLELSGDYRTAFDIGEDFDFTGMQVKALISDGTETGGPVDRSYH